MPDATTTKIVQPLLPEEAAGAQPVDKKPRTEEMPPTPETFEDISAKPGKVTSGMKNFLESIKQIGGSVTLYVSKLDDDGTPIFSGRYIMNTETDIIEDVYSRVVAKEGPGEYIFKWRRPDRSEEQWSQTLGKIIRPIAEPPRREIIHEPAPAPQTNKTEEAIGQLTGAVNRILDRLDYIESNPVQGTDEEIARLNGMMGTINRQLNSLVQQREADLRQKEEDERKHAEEEKIKLIVAGVAAQYEGTIRDLKAKVETIIAQPVAPVAPPTPPPTPAPKESMIDMMKGIKELIAIMAPPPAPVQPIQPTVAPKSAIEEIKSIIDVVKLLTPLGGQDKGSVLDIVKEMREFMESMPQGGEGKEDNWRTFWMDRLGKAIDTGVKQFDKLTPQTLEKVVSVLVPETRERAPQQQSLPGMPPTPPTATPPKPKKTKTPEQIAQKQMEDLAQKAFEDSIDPFENGDLRGALEELRKTPKSYYDIFMSPDGDKLLEGLYLGVTDWSLTPEETHARVQQLYAHMEGKPFPKEQKSRPTAPKAKEEPPKEQPKGTTPPAPKTPKEQPKAESRKPEPQKPKEETKTETSTPEPKPKEETPKEQLTIETPKEQPKAKEEPPKEQPKGTTPPAPKTENKKPTPEDKKGKK